VGMHMGHFFKHTRVAVPGLNGWSAPEKLSWFRSQEMATIHPKRPL